jgi:triosephosphate isomerase
LRSGATARKLPAAPIRPHADETRVTRKPLIAGNWKMNGSRSESRQLVSALRAGVGDQMAASMLLCPPSVYLGAVREWLEGSPLLLGAQNLADKPGAGALTGEISGAMLLDVGCSHVIVGHSERRALYGETDGVVARKFGLALAAGLTPILCVGETLAEREGGRTRAVVERQVEAVADSAGIAAFAKAIVAYEPVWAIGTGRTATAQQAQDVHKFIRGLLAALFGAETADAVRIQYGGSMKPENAAELLGQPDVDGGLIGGAALKADAFLGIIHAS